MKKPAAHSLSGVLSRLCKDQSGNVIAMAAAATLPLIGIVGGAVDMSRIYAVRIGLQAACDAGALTGRKTMSNGTWNTASINMANSVFTANFKNNAFGSSGLVRNFTGTGGLVTGTASADVPMTLMSIFGAETKNVSVTCTSNMRIPHTDVMFVLDTTGSMNCAPGDTLTGANGSTICTNNGGVEKTDSRIRGLRTAVNCFVETMAKAETGEVCATTGSDPAPVGLSASVQLRVGFVPYSSNINVGKLLPTAYFATNRTFQSREAVTTPIQTWADNGSSNTSTPSAWSGVARPSSYNTSYNSTSSFSSTWSDLGGTSTTQTINVTGGTAITRPTRITGTAGSTAANCTANNNYSTSPLAANRIEALGDLEGSISTAYGTYTTPTHPAANRTRTNTESRTNSLRGYMYRWVSTATSGTRCRLHVSNGNTPSTNWTQARNINETQPIAWTARQELTGWTYKPTTINVAGFKNGTAWNSSATLANTTSTSINVQKSGSSSTVAINIPESASIGWSGCIEERQTYMNTDGDPSDDWETRPSAAIDMDIDRVPDAMDATTLWGFALPGLIYSRADGSGNRTTANTTSGSALNTLACPREAQLLTGATDSTDTTRTQATNIRTYTNGLIATGGTYHDIGLLWGARLMSPSGIFAANNAFDSLGNPITRQRHMVFMTDGDTGTCSSSYTPYGISWWDRRQSNKALPNDDGGTPSCTNSHTNAITDARTELLCNEIKNKNITVWVVSFGLGVNAATETRLRQCASSATHFYDANSTAQLKTAFEEIALQISRLRLQS